MGDLREWSLNAAATLTPSRNPDLSAIGADCWEAAEQVTKEIISYVRPTVVSDSRRKEVIEFVQDLIRSSLGFEVFHFGSVPLQTYLPDGDIDLTSVGVLNVDDALAENVLAVLQDVECGMNTKFVVKDVQLIRAEVKIVKCLVQNIVVDISFNQLGGLCTLCFLEQVDRLIGKDHLFKRSIILIKAWCYYESRILGAHHGLISTYALETLVLYIFHVFHSSLTGPLAVLYKFLDYFSKFDWDNYCVSLSGPICISSFPEVTVESPENCEDLLLSNDFLRDCVNKFSVSSGTPEIISRAFQKKHLNIVDPLKNNNNLGRSVSKGNFFRIRSAFSYGARKLGLILSGKPEGLLGEVQKFFASTLDRHGHRQRPDVQDPSSLHSYTGLSPTSGFSGVDTREWGWAPSVSESNEPSVVSRKARLASSDSSDNGFVVAEIGGQLNDSPRISMMRVPIQNKSPDDSSAVRQEAPLVIHDSVKSSSVSSQGIIPPSNKIYAAPHMYLAHTRNENKNVSDEGQVPSCSNLISPKPLHSPDKDPNNKAYTNEVERQPSDDCDLMPNGSEEDPAVSCIASSKLDGFRLPCKDSTSNNSNKVLVPADSLADLGGDYELNLRNLQQARWFYERALIASVQAMQPVIPSQIAFRPNIFPPVSPGSNGVHQSPFYLVNQQMMNGAGFHIEEKPRMRGIGTYFPNVNHYTDSRPVARARNFLPMRSPRHNGHNVFTPDLNFLERAGPEFAPLHPYMPPGEMMHVAENLLRESPRRKTYPDANGSANSHEGVMEELGPLDQLVLDEPAREDSPHQEPTNPFSASSDASLGTQMPRPLPPGNQERIASKSFRLKDVGDFPPLSS
ncbi:unnamed protein product [Rhodiola kirilowii]